LKLEETISILGPRDESLAPTPEESSPPLEEAT